MIKATLKRSDGRHVLLIGLSQRNSDLLHEGRPIAFDLSEIGNPDVAKIVIVAGDTEESITKDLRQNGINLGVDNWPEGMTEREYSC